MIIQLISHLLMNAAYATPLVLYPGQAIIIKTPKSSRIQVERSGVIRVSDTRGKIKIVALKTGNTAIQLGKEKKQVNVLTKSNYKTYGYLIDWAKNKLGPVLKIKSGKISVTGQIHTFSDWLDLANFTRPESQFTMTAKIETSIENKIKAHLKKMSSQNGLPFPEFHKKPIWNLATDQNKQNVLKLYRKLFSPLGLNIKHSPFSLSSLPMIEVRILVTEIKRSRLMAMGIKWPSVANAQLVPGLSWADGENLLLQTNAFEQNGMGKVLASPTLITQSGKEAAFHSGGEIPIKTSNQFNASIIWKKYGILLKIKPKADFSGKMSIEVSCEVSMVDSSQTIEGIPALLNNTVSSHFNINKSKTIAISGLIREEWGKSKEGLPGLQHIPILGPLFSSHNYRNEKTELMFFVTPKVIY